SYCNCWRCNCSILIQCHDFAFCLVNIYDHCSWHHIRTGCIDQFNTKLLVIAARRCNDCRSFVRRMFVQNTWIAVAISAFLTLLVAAVTARHCLLWLLFIVLNIILLRWLVVMLTARMTLVFTCFMALFLTRHLNHFFMHLMLLRCRSFRLNLLARFFVLRVRVARFLVVTWCPFFTLCRFFCRITFLFLCNSRWCQVSIIVA